MSDRGYEKLKVYRLSHSFALEVHKMSLNLPNFEKFEEGSQIRRSSKSVSTNIVEGYALRKYKNEYIHYLLRAYASAQETVEHLKYIFETGSLREEPLYEKLREGYSKLYRMLFRFLESVDEGHKTDVFTKERRSF